MGNNFIQWLHLSDFHVGKDHYGERELFKSLIKHIKEKPKFDLLFITGDIVNSGKESEYLSYCEAFLDPLLESIDKTFDIFIVPGNHDLDRSKEEFVTREAIYCKGERFFDPNSEGLKKRKSVLSRFKSFTEYMSLYTCGQKKWLDTEEGAYFFKKEINGRKIGILCINTAWLSENDTDEQRLTPGVPLIKNGIENISDCEYKFVIGHHPIDWFKKEDREVLEVLFAKNNVIYLNGHKHEGNYGIQEKAGSYYLVLQSGATFQCREGEKWKNGFMWGRLDFETNKVILEPRIWNKKYQEWSIDTTVFPSYYKIEGEELWFYDMPGGITKSIYETKKIESLKKIKKNISYDGWEIIDLEYLERLDKEPDENEILSYFDGKLPNWRLALCPDIPKRGIVRKVVKHIIDAKNDIGIYVLLGAGGEGKTTALYQITEQVIKTSDSWRVLYHRSDRNSQTYKIINSLPDLYNWLIVSDDADLIAEEVYQVANELRKSDKKNIYFALSARFTDWRNTAISSKQWEVLPGYSEFSLRDLNEEDARLIVNAWSKYKEKGLGKLAGLPINVAVEKFVYESKSEKSINDGALLGALLRIRIGNEMKQHVKKMLDRLQESQKSINNNISLLYAFVCIAAMHSANLLFLSKTVLSKALCVNFKDLRSKVLYPLGEEAAADIAGEMVFTRHRAIAETAIDILTDSLNYDVDIDEVYINLVQSAEEAYQSGDFVPNLAGWRHGVADYFFDKGNIVMAIRVIRASLSVYRNHAHLQVKLSKYYRLAGQPEQSINVFRNACATDDDRVFLSEWAKAEGDVANYALSTALYYIAISDQISSKSPSITDAKINLKGFCISCYELYKKTANQIFGLGAIIAAEFLIKISSHKYYPDISIIISIKSKVEKQIPIIDLKYPKIELFRRVGLYSYNNKEDNIPEWIIKADIATFNKLEIMLDVDKWKNII